jgi:signal peptidase I
MQETPGTGGRPAGDPRTVLPSGSTPTDSAPAGAGSTPAGSTPGGAGPAPDVAAGTDVAVEADPTPPRGNRKSTKSGGREHWPSFAVELIGLVLIAVLLALVIKAFVVQAFYIPSGSMEQTLHINDRVLVNKLVYRVRDVHRGEIVVFTGKGSNFANIFESQPTTASNPLSRGVQDVQRWLGLGAPGENDFIKRVIGIGGDTVACCDTQGRVMVNGKALDEPYIYENTALSQRHFGPVKVPKGRLFVMGDHRGASEDSRFEGTIPESSVVGRAFVRVWPLNRFAFLRVPSTFSHVPSSSAVGLVSVVSAVVLLRRRRLS